MDTVLGKALFERLWVSAPSSTKAADGLGPLFNARACSSCHQGGGRAAVSLQEGDLPASAGLALRVGAAKDGKLVPHPVLGSQVQTFAVPGLSSEGKLRLTFETHDGAAGRRHGGRTAPAAHRDRGAGDAERSRLAVAAPGAGPAWRWPAGARSARAPRGAGGPRRSRRRRHLRFDGHGPVWRRGYRARPLRLEGRRTGPRSPDFRRVPFRSRPRNAGASGIVGRLHRRRSAIAAPRRKGPRPAMSKSKATWWRWSRPICVRLPAPAGSAADAAQGGAIFAQIGCGACHTSQQPAELASGETIWFSPYTDLLVHDMGDGLADRAADDSISTVAGARDWRTAPLWGLGARVAQPKGANLLHDGRARSILEAILWHGGEAAKAKQRAAGIAAGGSRGADRIFGEPMSSSPRRFCPAARDHTGLRAGGRGLFSCGGLDCANTRSFPAIRRWRRRPWTCSYAARRSVQRPPGDNLVQAQ